MVVRLCYENTGLIMSQKLATVRSLHIIYLHVCTESVQLPGTSALENSTTVVQTIFAADRRTYTSDCCSGVPTNVLHTPD
ncbi:hypothetical protein KC19_10G019700 [Ceratodon purpureus]|uniref:Uncharacterized protein n=1 Tax=Ceratodon purpureus TaxID=3225 RepID=A0A8T0GJI0_CERPU|nr:hypothetical protein KC19_10G019700 [Ceratodon purpureus]